MKALAGRFAVITLAAVVLCVGGYWFFFAGGSARLLAGSSQQAASTSSQEKAQEGKAANGGEAAAVDAKDVKEAQEKAKEEADKEKEKKEGKSPYSLQVMILEAKRVESIEGAKEDGPFLIVKASIANADKQQPVSVVPQGISLTDSDQERHSVSKDGMAALAARQTPVFNAVDIPPGAAATASLVFELDADEHPSVLTIQPAGGGDVMKFHLPESVKGI